MNQLPRGWKFAPLGQLGKYINGRAFKPVEWEKKGLPIIRIQNLNDPTAQYNYSLGKYDERFKVRKGDLLIAWSASLGAFIWEGEDAWLNQHIFRVEPNTDFCTKEFLFYVVRYVIDELYDKAHGSGIVHVTKPVFEAHEVCLPPLSEQFRIVSKLERLLAKVEGSKERLVRIPILLKRLRQSILEAACSGYLTIDWRKAKDKEKWQDVTLGDVIEDKPKNGYSAKPVNQQTPWRVLTLTATTSGKFDDRYFKYFDEPIPQNSSLWLQPGDILVQRGNTIEYVGVSAIYNGLPNQFIYPDLMMRFRASTRIKTKFLYYALSWEKTRNYLRDRATGTAGNMPKINQGTLIGAPIKLPSIEEQEEIISRVEALFTLTDKIEIRYKKAQKQVNRLTQSIFTQVFKGQLASQDANEESAVTVLRR